MASVQSPFCQTWRPVKCRIIEMVTARLQLPHTCFSTVATSMHSIMKSSLCLFAFVLCPWSCFSDPVLVYSYTYTYRAVSSKTKHCWKMNSAWGLVRVSSPTVERLSLTMYMKAVFHCWKSKFSLSSLKIRFEEAGLRRWFDRTSIWLRSGNNRGCGFKWQSEQAVVFCPPPKKNTLNYSFKAPLRFAVMGTWLCIWSRYRIVWR